MESKFTWDDMEMCQVCHYKDENPDICNAYDPPRVKPGGFSFFDSCGRFLRESKYRRMGEEHIKHFEYWKNK